MSKRSCFLSKAANSIITGAVLASLVALDAFTSGSASAQSKAGQPSPTLQRLQQLQQVERDRKSAEDAKWRSFPGFYYGTSNHLDRFMGPKRPPECEFYWPGWKLQSDGTRVTKVRSCYSTHWVAVDCRSLKVSWHSYGLSSLKVGKWDSWEIPQNTTDFGLQTTQMVAALCDNISPSMVKDTQPQTSIPVMPVRTAWRPGPAIKPGLPIPDNAQMSIVNVGAGGEQILELLGNIGVKSVIAKTCPKAGAIAAYSRFDNLLVMCKESLLDPSLATEAIAHVAVHALQDCLQPGGIKGSDSVTLTRFFKTFNEGKQSADFRDLIRMGLVNRPKVLAYLEELKKSMPCNMYLMEIEAHALEAAPKTVKILLETFSPLCSLPAQSRLHFESSTGAAPTLGDLLGVIR